MMIAALWQISSKQWRTHGLRVIMTTLGIALGVAVFFAVRIGRRLGFDIISMHMSRNPQEEIRVVMQES